MRPATELVHYDPSPHDPFHPNSTPIYQTATFGQPAADRFGEYDYTRSGNPTRSVLEGQLARMERAERAFAFASGMAALTALTRTVAAGGAVLAGDDLYGGTYRLLSRVLPGHGIRVRYADATDLAAMEEALAEGPQLVLVESPTNPLLRVVDLEGLAGRVHARGALLAVDNSALSPYLQRPLELGADAVVHSATKHLGGHGDLTAGVVAVRDRELAERLAFVQNAEGAGLAPFESWLLLRGIKTLGVRLDRQQASAQRVAEHLATHPQVSRVHYPGLDTHPGRAIHFRQARGAGSLISLLPRRPEMARILVESTQLFRISVSFGSVGSLASLPSRMSHSSIPPEVRASRALPEHLVRLSIGLEDAEDLIEDLDQALEEARRRV